MQFICNRNKHGTILINGHFNTRAAYTGRTIDWKIAFGNFDKMKTTRIKFIPVWKFVLLMLYKLTYPKQLRMGTGFTSFSIEVFYFLPRIRPSGLSLLRISLKTMNPRNSWQDTLDGGSAHRNVTTYTVPHKRRNDAYSHVSSGIRIQNPNVRVRPRVNIINDNSMETLKFEW